jgi:hypothetical protein
MTGAKAIVAQGTGTARLRPDYRRDDDLRRGSASASHMCRPDRLCSTTPALQLLRQRYARESMVV